MAIYYQTEYRLGRRGGRICRRYTGLRATLAIAIDLFFILTFELVLGLLFFVVKNVLRLLTVLFFILSLPFRAARWVSQKLEHRPDSGPNETVAGIPLKPAWAGYDEV